MDTLVSAATLVAILTLVGIIAVIVGADTRDGFGDDHLWRRYY
jgi:hypothetical protein